VHRAPLSMYIRYLFVPEERKSFFFDLLKLPFHVKK
jgi:hypothetical protein